MWTAVQGPGRSWPAKAAGMGGTPAGKGLIADTMFVLWPQVWGRNCYGDILAEFETAHHPGWKRN